MKKALSLSAIVLIVCLVSMLSLTACNIDLENADSFMDYEVFNKEGSVEMIASFFEETIKDPDMVITCKNEVGEVLYTETVKGTASFIQTKDGSKTYAYKVGDFYYVAHVNYETTEGETVETHNYSCSDDTKLGYYDDSEGYTLANVYKNNFCQFMNDKDGVNSFILLDGEGSYNCKTHSETTEGVTTGSLTFNYTSKDVTIALTATSEEKKVKNLSLSINYTAKTDDNIYRTWTFVYGGASVTLPDIDAWDSEDAANARAIAPQKLEIASNYVEVLNNKNHEYTIAVKGELPDWSKAKAGEKGALGVRFDGLDSATVYTVYARVKAKGNYPASEPAAVDVLTSLETVPDYTKEAVVDETFIYPLELLEGLDGLTFRWYRNDNVVTDYSDAVLIEGATFNTYTPKEADLGKYLYLVVSKDGFELDTAVIGPVEPPIREDLKALYDLLNAEGDKGVKMTLTSNYSAASYSVPKSYAINAIFNVLEEEGCQFALYGEDQKEVFALYKDNEVLLGKNVIDVSRLVQLSKAFLTVEDSNKALNALDEESENKNIDSLTSGFIMLSNILNVFDTLTTPLLMNYPGLDITHLDGIYNVSGDSKTLLSLLQNIVFYDATDEKAIAFNAILSKLDKSLDGAIKNGKLDVQAMVVISDDGVLVNVRFKNTDTGLRANLQVSVQVSDKAFELPVVENTVVNDLRITIPVTLPQEDISFTIDAVVHISDMFSALGKDYITAYVTANDETLVSFNLNDYSVYLDITGLLDMFSEEETPYTAFYYTLTNAEEEPISFLDYMLDSVMRFYSDFDKEENLNYMPWLSYIRFVEIGENDESMTIVRAAVNNFKAIINDEVNKALFADKFTIEKLEDGFVVNAKNIEDIDLFAIVNLFVGIPCENDGFKNIDKDMILNYLRAKCEEYDDPVFANSVCDKFEEAITNLALDSGLRLEVRSSDKDGSKIAFKLSDCSGENVYLVFDVNVSLISPIVESFELPVGETNDIKQLDDYILPILTQILGIGKESQAD